MEIILKQITWIDIIFALATLFLSQISPYVTERTPGKGHSIVFYPVLFRVIHET